MKTGIAYIVITIIVIIISFFLTAGLVRLACWAFDFYFTWKLAAGVWAVIWLLKSIFGRSGK